MPSFRIELGLFAVKCISFKIPEHEPIPQIIPVIPDAIVDKNISPTLPPPPIPSEIYWPRIPSDIIRLPDIDPTKYIN